MNVEVGDRVTYKHKNEKGKITTIVDTNCEVDYLRREDIKILKVERPNWTVVEEKKNLLTEEEREFLKQFIKFNSKTNIQQIERDIKVIYLEEIKNSGFGFHYDSGFNGLEINKIYTLSELRTGGLNE